MFCKTIFFLFFCSGMSVAIAQNVPAKKDSTKVYRDIEKFSQKRKSTSFLYGLFFRPMDTPATTTTSKKKPKRFYQKPYNLFEGKIIRNIYINTLDPFGYNINDTVVTPQANLYKAGNSLHIKTLPFTIRNLLLFKKNEPFDSLIVKESERLIRLQKYVHEVLFYPQLASKNSDSVDILIRVLDIWSIEPDGAISTSVFDVEAIENNFLGTGHQFSNDIALNLSSGHTAYKVGYVVPNFKNTYISTTLHYSNDENRNVIKSVDVERPFFSPFAKWAAGAYAGQHLQNGDATYPDSTRELHTYKFNTQDYWAGKAWQIFKSNSEEARTTNLILTGRYLRIRYLQKPAAMFDSLHVFSNEDFYLSSVGISARKYFQDKYVFNYGVIEDVPIGKVYAVTGGYQIKNNIGRMYAGAKVSWGNYNDWGYLSYNFEYGTFFHSSHTEQGVFAAGVNYFSDLFRIGKWNFRQFVKPQLTLGLNRLPSDSITINNENGLRGFSTSYLSGTKKFVVTLQTQSYAPWNVLGFRFGPYLIYSLGMLGNQTSGFNDSHLYSQFAFGVLIKNEFLVFNIFQISFAFYPVIPGEGDNIFKINPNSTTDFGFRDFEIGKPGVVAFQ